MKLNVLGVASFCSLLSTIACGTSDGSSRRTEGPATSEQTAGFPKEMLPAELVPNLALVAPKSDLDIPLFSDPVNVGPGEDVTFCTYTNVVLDEATIFGETFGAQSPQGHHSILQYATTPVEPGTGACNRGDMDASILLGGTGGKSVADKSTLPPNYGIEVPAGAQLVINHHWINTSEETVRGQTMMLARRLERGGDTVLGGNMIMIGFGWEIPAQAQYSYSTECTFGGDVSYVTALGHMHEYGSNVTIDVTRPTGEVESMINRRWTADEATGASGREIYSLDNPFKINKGDTVKLTCNWSNTTSEALAFPREMCVFFGNTVGSNNFCANGSWLDAAAAKAAGASDVINNL